MQASIVDDRETCYLDEVKITANIYVVIPYSIERQPGQRPYY